MLARCWPDPRWIMQPWQPMHGSWRYPDPILYTDLDRMERAVDMRIDGSKAHTIWMRWYTLHGCMVDLWCEHLSAMLHHSWADFPMHIHPKHLIRIHHYFPKPKFLMLQLFKIYIYIYQWTFEKFFNLLSLFYFREEVDNTCSCIW